MSQKITSENWNTAQFTSDNLIAFVSIGAEPNEDGQINFLYHVTLSNTDYEDLFQSSYSDLEAAIAVLNQKYGHWPLKSLSKTESSESGCGSCAAH